MFHEALGVTGLILTKLDGTAKGGIVVSTSYTFKIPLRFIGIGEHLPDLHPFDAQEFVEALL
ncbi:MAG: Signal recognition particle receptor FtsY [Candidatus Methanoperedenaceae archaeon GB37]|nr:MAG: Signal recognition particle receptor FtsY [Candidatus Methanoperedenaceae archaeon GB37]